MTCREDKEVSKYGDLINARSEMLAHVKKLIEENPVFCDKLIFPTFDPSALGTLRFISSLFVISAFSFRLR